MTKVIDQDKIIALQKEWGKGLIDIGKLYLQKKDYKEITKAYINRFYGYREGKVLFKPTRAGQIQFRTTFESALSYFIGDNADFPEDLGFALQPWKKVRFDNHEFIVKENYAFVLGNYYFTSLTDEEYKVEFTLGFFIGKNGELKINLHHSSIPYNL